MKEENEGLNEADVFMYAKAKMKRLHVTKLTDVEVDQYSNLKHEKQHESLRINAPDELEDGKTYKDATIGTKRGVSIKEE